MTEIPKEALAWVERLHAAVDEIAAPVAAEHRARLACRRGCSECCVDGITVFAIEAALLAERHAALLAEQAPHEEGACAFLDADGACRAYASRPYVCRTQGLPLRWIEEVDGAIAESRDVCPKNLEGVALEELPASAFFPLGPIEERLAAKQASVDDGNMTRVALRDLFANAATARRRLPVVP